jgi:hypothetical protein
LMPLIVLMYAYILVRYRTDMPLAQ